MSNEEEYPVRSYLTDDRDGKVGERMVLDITFAPNGDWYLGTRPEKQRVGTGKPVRFCTSGGASSEAPQALRAVVDLFHGLGGFANEASEAALLGAKPLSEIRQNIARKVDSIIGPKRHSVLRDFEPERTELERISKALTEANALARRNADLERELDTYRGNTRLVGITVSKSGDRELTITVPDGIDGGELVATLRELVEAKI